MYIGIKAKENIQIYNMHDANNIKGGEGERKFTKETDFVTDNTTETNC